MRTPRLFHPAPLCPNSTTELSDTAVIYISKVLRLKPGHPLILFNGQGGEYSAVVESVEKRRVSVTLLNHIDSECESPLSITLVQAVSKGERMDFTMQKAVELGVNCIVPVFSERSVVNLKGERLARRLEHWQGVVVSACEQSGRNRLPVIEEADTLSLWLQKNPLHDRPGLLLQPESQQTLMDLAPPSSEVVLLIGPEGGFSEQEIEEALAAGFQGIRLGPRVLRTETAGITALSAIQLLWGDLGSEC